MEYTVLWCCIAENFWNLSQQNMRNQLHSVWLRKERGGGQWQPLELFVTLEHRGSFELGHS